MSNSVSIKGVRVKGTESTTHCEVSV